MSLPMFILCSKVLEYYYQLQPDGPIVRTSSNNHSQRLSTVSNTFEQDINLGYDLFFVLITGPKCLCMFICYSFAVVNG